MTSYNLFIFRRDLRLSDNVGLNYAMNNFENIIPIFIFTPEQISDKNKFKSNNAIQFMIESLKELNSEPGNWGTGGIKTKLSAARIATASGITVHLADGRNPHILEQLLQGSKKGTVFHPNPNPIGTRKSWLAYALKPLRHATVVPEV